MPYEQQSRYAYTAEGTRYLAYDYAHLWARSPRVNGKLILQANDWSLLVHSQTLSNSRTDGTCPELRFLTVTRGHPTITRAIEIAESDLRGSLARAVRNKEVAGLGVSIASAKQSIDMLRASSTSVGQIFLSVERFYRTTRGRKRLKRFRRLIARGAEPTAGKVLEGFFGWQPLFQDMFAACATLSNPWPPNWVSRKSHWNVNGQISTDFDGVKSRTSWSATGHSTYATQVVIDNPNLWVANKLGLINPVAVAWDLVPWSFLVNMVSNFGQIAGSLTDFAGLTLRNGSLTRTIVLTQSGSQYWSSPSIPPRFASGYGTSRTKNRERVVGAPPPSVSPYLRLPNWNVGMAAISGALLVQNTRRISRILGYQ